MGIVSLMRAARSLPARSGEVMSKRHEIRGITVRYNFVTISF